MYSFPVVSHELIVTNSIVDDVEAKSDPNNVNFTPKKSLMKIIKLAFFFLFLFFIVVLFCHFIVFFLEFLEK